MITQVTPQIYIGNAFDARKASSKMFDATLNVAVDLDIEDKIEDDTQCVHLRRHKVGLMDGPGNNPLQMVSALILLHSLISNGNRVLVHCQAGMSRSVMTCAAYLSLVGISSLDDVLSKIMSLRKVDAYSVAMYNLAQSAVPIAKQVIKYEFPK
jgi:protein-tyrosine phosphatase